jgi:tetratricopeptide (TPR) repeat protein
MVWFFFDVTYSFHLTFSSTSTALNFYQICTILRPNNPSVFASIGLTYHQSGRLDKAIDHYHHALGLQYDDDTSKLLDLAVSEWMEFSDHTLPT